MTLGQFITKKRKELGYKKGEFSKIIGITRGSLKSWEDDKFMPAGRNRRELMRALQFTERERELYFSGSHHA